MTPKLTSITPNLTPHRVAIQAIRSELKARFYERDNVIDGLLSALLSRQHGLLLGPPGTAKSDLVNALVGSIDGARSFSWLLTKFSTPEEVFGPVSLSKLQQDRFARITTGKLPEAHIGFLDEIFKANSAILNSLLTLANERVYHNDGAAQSCPLLSLVGASNETPEDQSLSALYDRFAVRYWVPYLTETRNVWALLSGIRASASTRITLAELETAISEASRVDVPDGVLDTLIKIKQTSEDQGSRSSDRRWKQIIGLVRARAYLDGSDVARDEHLEILADALWSDPKDRASIAQLVSTIASPVTVKTNELIDSAREAIARLPAQGQGNQARADWVRDAALTDSALASMLQEVESLRAQYGAHARIESAKRTIESLKSDLLAQVSKAYRI